MISVQTPEIAAVRAFNRFYTRLIGALDAGHLETRFTLGEARLIYEVGTRGTTSATELARAMSVDPAYVSRLVGRLKQDGLLMLAPNAGDRRQADISLSPAGGSAFTSLDAGSNERIAALLTPLEPARRSALVAAMSAIRAVLGDAMHAAPLLIRPHRVGELGWLIHRQAILYNQQFGWNIEFEALIAGLYHDFEQAPAAPPKALWIAERRNMIVGSVFAMPSEGREGTAQLRMLYVEPEARGLGIGRALVDQCIRFARESGYSRVRLWTQSVLVSARRIYADAGFRLVETRAHHSFGHDLEGETWELEL